MDIKITKIDQNEIKNNDSRYNVSNLEYTEDYEKVMNWSNTKNWIEQFQTNFHKINITSQYDIKWIKDAHKIGCVTNNFSNMYIDELNDFCERYKKYNEYMKDGVFVRTEHVSLKTGKHKIGPYYNMKSIIESICTSKIGHSPVRKNDNEINIYLIPWIVINEDKEFRIFVHGNIITGISVQHLYRNNNWLSSMNECEIKSFVKEILCFFSDEFIGKWKNTKVSKETKNFTFDLALDEKHKFYFIEQNPFGSNYAAGSSLFHWTIDKVLYNTDGIVEFRYT